MTEPQSKGVSWETSRIQLAIAALVAAGGIGVMVEDLGEAGVGGFIFAIGCASMAWCLPQMIVEVLRRGRLNVPKN